MEVPYGNRQDTRARRYAGWLLVGGIVILSVVISFIVARSHDDDVEQRRQAEANRVALALDAVSALSIAQLRSAAAFIELNPALSSADFQRLVAAMAAEQPIAAVSYIEAERLGIAAGRAAPLRDDTHHYPVRLTATDGTVGQILPAGQASAEHISAVLEEARRSGLPAATRVVRLRDDDRGHLILFYPVRHDRPRVDHDDGHVTGFTAGVVRVDDLLASAATAAPAGTEVALVGENGEVIARSEDELEDYASTEVVVAGRRWELRLVVPEEEVSALPLVLGLGGLALAATIGVLVLNWSRRERHALELARTRLEERDRAMRTEAETNRMYRLLAENLTDMVIVTDPDGRITYVSPAGVPMLGWSAEEMIGRLVFDFLYADDKAEGRLHLLALGSDAAILTFEHRLMRKDGSHIWVESAARSVVDAESESVFEIQATIRDISERKPLQDRLEQLAHEDPLTGLSNRRQFEELLAAEVARTARSGGRAVVLMIDIDHFKKVNDTFGHLTGDRVLRRVAEMMKSRMRLSDTLARFGGDEFAAILPEAGEDEGLTVAEAIIDEVGKALAAEPDLPVVTVSIGIAGFDAGGVRTPDEVLQRADMAMYSAKTGGGNRARVYRPDEMVLA